MKIVKNKINGKEVYEWSDSDAYKYRITFGMLLGKGVGGDVYAGTEVKLIRDSSGQYVEVPSSARKIAIKKIKVSAGFEDVDSRAPAPVQARAKEEEFLYSNIAASKMPGFVGGRYMVEAHVEKEKTVITDTFVVMDAYNGSSLDKVLKNGLLDKHKNAIFTALVTQVGEGLKRFHEMGCVHSDIAARNILVQSNADNTFKLSVSDYGYSEVHLKKGVYKPFESTLKEKNRPFKWTGYHLIATHEEKRSDLISAWNDIHSYKITLLEVKCGLRNLAVNEWANVMRNEGEGGYINLILSEKKEGMATVDPLLSQLLHFGCEGPNTPETEYSEEMQKQKCKHFYRLNELYAKYLQEGLSKKELEEFTSIVRKDQAQQKNKLMQPIVKVASTLPGKDYGDMPDASSSNSHNAYQLLPVAQTRLSLQSARPESTPSAASQVKPVVPTQRPLPPDPRARSVNREGVLAPTPPPQAAKPGYNPAAIQKGVPVVRGEQKFPSSPLSAAPSKSTSVPPVSTPLSKPRLGPKK